MQIKSINAFKNAHNIRNLKTQQDISCAPLRDAVSNNSSVQYLTGYYGILPKKNVSFGSYQKFIRSGADEVILQLSDIAKKAASVKVELFSKDKLKGEEIVSVLSSAKRQADGNFHIEIPAINRTDNSFLESLRTGKIVFSDIDGKTIQTVDESGAKFSPAHEFAKITEKRLFINGNERYCDFEIISSADTAGIYRVFDNYDEIKKYKEARPVCAVLATDKAFEGLLIDTLSEDFSLPSAIKSIIVKKPENSTGGQFFLNCLSHAKCRLDGKQAFVVAGKETFEALTSAYKDGKSFIKLTANTGELSTSALDELPAFDSKVVLEPIKKHKGLLSAHDRGFVPAAVGIKAYNLAKLQEISAEGGFEVPKFFAITAGEFDTIKQKNPIIYHRNSVNPEMNGLYHKYIQLLDNAYDTGVPIDTGLESMQSVIKKDMFYPESFIQRLHSKISSIFGEMPENPKLHVSGETIKDNDIVLSVRSSFPNFEDLDKVSTQGMFSSVGGVRSYAELLPAIKKVWASKWGEIAYRARREHSIPHNSVQPAVVVQEFVKDIDYIFTGYTRKVDEPNKLLIDLSQGVTSNMQGNPYLFELNRETGEIQRTLLATKGRKKNIEHIDLMDKANKKYTSTDYSQDPFNLSRAQYAPIIKKIADTLLFVEKHFGGKAQDIEGGIKFIRDAKGNITDVKITLWQTRNVQMPN